MKFKRFERNTIGRDFVTGDLHGHFKLLDKLLAEIGFDKFTDRLFSVGDLIDRGPDSHLAVEWLREPWFHCVRGNHEQMAIDGCQSAYWAETHMLNGGLWFYRLEIDERKAMAAEFDKMPYAIEVDTEHGLVGIVHADMPLCDWAIYREALQDEQIAALPGTGNIYEKLLEHTLWSRKRIGMGNVNEVENVHRVYVGHTNVSPPKILGNVCYIDTGCGSKKAGSRLTIVCLNDGVVINATNISSRDELS